MRNQVETLPSEESSKSNVSEAKSTYMPSTLNQFIQHSGRFIIWAWSGFNDFMTVPLWASFISVIVACIAPLQHTIQVHLPPLTGAISSVGDCSIPVTLVVLGAYFYPSHSNKSQDLGVGSREPVNSSSTVRVARITELARNFRNIFSTTKNECIDTRGETKTIIIAILSRMVLTPAILLPIIALAKHFTIHPLFQE